ncbi:hypothetical protein [Streptomyces sp. NPDC018059]|uniref:hypothetical protein n=1 Tax=Streptomyces sp. NPDC018059 TaxID=3365041 RepID=UPI0037974A97
MDDARIRDITRELPPASAGQLFTAREQGVNERQLQQIAADGLAQMYFRATTAARTGRAWSSPTPNGSTSRGRAWELSRRMYEAIPLVVDRIEEGMPIGGRIRRYRGGRRQDAVAGLVGITRRPGPLIRSA